MIFYPDGAELLNAVNDVRAGSGGFCATEPAREPKRGNYKLTRKRRTMLVAMKKSINLNLNQLTYSKSSLYFRDNLNWVPFFMSMVLPDWSK